MGGGYAFIKDKEYAWYPVKLVDQTEGKEAKVIRQIYPNEQAIWCDAGKGAKKKGEEKTIKLKDYVGGVLPMQNVDGAGMLKEFPDMVELPFLHEAGILYNLKARHAKGKPYTRTGDIIVAINPFQWFTEIYTDSVRTKYSNKLVWEDCGEKDPRRDIAPHVYETSCLCFKGLAFGQIDQSILVSGESGAGKTETVKICMNHIASVQRGPVKGSSGGDAKFIDPVVQRVLMSNPLLEAFGNASTLRNDNSSRFGKYTQLQFDNQNAAEAAKRNDKTKSFCTLAGSKCDSYLLEKNRITGHGEGERTYHIFYQLIIGQAHSKKYWSELGGTTLDSFKYVGKTDKLKIEGMTDDKHFDVVVDTMKLIKVDGDALTSFMRSICAVMQCGNLIFGPKGGDSDLSECTSAAEMKKLSGLLGVDGETVSLSFTERTMKTRNETYKVPLNPETAKDSADAFAKEVYGKTFLWLVQQINIATCAEDNYQNGSLKDYQFGVIGLLDIFGFESFKMNRFEQLCINYANEKLQQKFTEDIFLAVQEEYESEGIDLAEISYDDNTDVLQLIESKTGLCAMLNEECMRPKGNPEAFVNKAFGMNKRNPAMIENKQNSRLSFGVHHFAGKVIYTCNDFVSRNQDSLPVDLEECMKASTNFIVAFEMGGGQSAKASKRSKSNITGDTVWTKYKTQLAKLMGDLRKTKSKYIRCIKPNQAKVPIKMDHIGTVEQLRCAGVIAAITLANSAYPSKLENATCVERFDCMWDRDKYPSSASSSDDPNTKSRKDCEALFKCALKDKKKDGKDSFVIGRTRSYFRSGSLEFLENHYAEYYAEHFAKQAAERAARLAKEEAEREEREKREAKEAAEREEREAKEAAEREGREARQAEDAAKRAEKLKREAKEKVERAAKEKAERLERLKREAEEQAEKEAKAERKREKREAKEALLAEKRAELEEKKRVEAFEKAERVAAIREKSSARKAKMEKEFEEMDNQTESMRAEQAKRDKKREKELAKDEEYRKMDKAGKKKKLADLKAKIATMESREDRQQRFDDIAAEKAELERLEKIKNDKKIQKRAEAKGLVLKESDVFRATPNSNLDYMMKKGKKK